MPKRVDVSYYVSLLTTFVYGLEERTVTSIVLIGMIASARPPKRNVKATQSENTIKNNVICLTANESSLEAITTNYSAKWMRTLGIIFGHFRIRTSKKCSFPPSSSAFKIQKSMRKLRDGMLGIGSGAI